MFFVKSKSVVLVAATLIGMAALPASAGVTININGKVLPTACEINAADVSQTVTLSERAVTDFPVGSAMQLSATPFSFRLTGCDASFTKVVAKVDGNKVTSSAGGDVASDVLESTGTATNVGIALLGKTSITTSAAGALNVGEESAEGAITAGTGKVTLAAQIAPLDPAQAVGAGTVAADAVVTLTYS